MAPDLNTLPVSSRSNSTRTVPINTSPEVSIMRGQTPSPIQRSGSTSIATTSLQAAAAVNAGLYHEESRRMSGNQSAHRNPKAKLIIQKALPTVHSITEVVGKAEEGRQF